MIVSGRRVGIVFEHQAVAAALVARGRRGKTKVLAKVEHDLPADFWRDDAPALEDLMLRLAKALGPEARRADVPVALALPEPLIGEEVVSFKEVPQDSQALQELILWRIARDRRSTPDALACTYEPLQGGDEPPAFRVRILPSTLITRLTDSATAAGLALDVVEGISRFRSHGTGQGLNVDVLADGGGWAVMAASDTRRQVLADWAGSGASGGKIGRVIKTLALGQGTEVAQIRIEASGALLGEIEEALKSSGVSGKGEVHAVKPEPLIDRAAAVAVAK